MIDKQVVASSDDCFRRLTSSYWDLAHVHQLVGATHATDCQEGGGMRFRTVALPQGCTIHTAYLTLRASLNYSGTVCNSRISAEDRDDAPTFADDAAAFDSRWANRTTARVDWDNIPAWTENVDYNSPSIVSVIQEIVNRAGWASGNDIVIFWEDFENRTTITSNYPLRLAYSYDSSTTYAPKLHIEYTVPPTVTTQTVIDIVGTTATGQGNITSLGDPNPTAHGVCWNTTGTPTTADSHTDEGAASATGVFTTGITGLTAETKYYVRAYATNDGGTVYGNQVFFWAGKGTVYPDSALRRASGIRRTFWAGLGGQALYQAELALGGMSASYASSIGSREPESAVRPGELTPSAQRAAALKEMNDLLRDVLAKGYTYEKGIPEEYFTGEYGPAWAETESTRARTEAMQKYYRKKYPGKPLPPAIAPGTERMDELNIQLGGRYINGVLTPPASFSGSATQWVQYLRKLATGN